MSINVTRSSMPDFDDYVEAIRPVFDSHVLTNMGPVYQQLKARLREYLGVERLSMFVNGHLALEVAIQALGLRAGGEVITTPFTFVSTTHAIARNNLTPVFCDIRAEDYTIDPDKIEALITKKTAAIVPVHVYGNLCDVEAIQAIADRHGLKVIYDAAHAFGVTYNGVGVGNFGDASMFSFHATKVFNTIEGGAIAYKDEKYAQPLHELKNFGLHGAEEITAIAGNAKMNEFAAAMGLCNLRRMDACIAGRKAAYDRYVERLSGAPGVRLCAPQPGVSANYAYFPVYFDETRFGHTRDDVFAALNAQDIHARKYFYPAINETAAYRHIDAGDTPVARDAARHILTLPMYEELSTKDVDRICDVILNLRG